MTVKEADTEESMESSEGENNSSSAGPVEPIRTSEPAGSVEPTQTPEPAEPAEPIETAEPKQTQKPIETVKPAQTEKPAETPKATEIPAQPEAPVQPSRPEVPAQPSQPAHQHTWKDHVVTTQIWIPNIVVVEDYGEIPGESYDYFVCSCGYETEDADAIRAHYKDGVRVGTCTNFGIQTRYRESTYGVIGTHEEDQGHYETSSYVDYQYCDCGATK